MLPQQVFFLFDQLWRYLKTQICEYELNPILSRIKIRLSENDNVLR